MAFITLVTADGRRQTRGLTEAMVIGRGDSCDWIVPDKQLSRRHVRIQHEVDGWEARDLESTNGTIVDGRRVSLHRLRHGEELTIGSVTLVFTLEDTRQITPVNDDDRVEIPPAKVSSTEISAASVSRTDGPLPQSWSLRNGSENPLSWETILASTPAEISEGRVPLGERLERINSIWQEVPPKQRRRAVIVSVGVLLLGSIMAFRGSSPRLPSAKVDATALDHAAVAPKSEAAIQDQPV
jgi:pSer/pThr/pTyr-binding forkhead associated (FHA) protein